MPHLKLHNSFCGRDAAASLPGRPRHGLHRPRARRDAASRRLRPRRGQLGRRPNGQPHFRAESEERHLAVHDRRREPRRELRSEAGAQQVRRQVDRRNAVQATCSTRSFSTRTSAPLAPDLRKILSQIYPLQVGYRKRGESGIEVSDWWPHVGGCVDDLAVIRSMWTNDIDHGAQLQFHTGRNMLDGYFPDDRLVGALRPGHAQRKPAAVRRDGQPRGRLLRRPGSAPRQLSRPRARRRAARGRPGQPARLRPAAATASIREEQQAEFELLDRLEPARAGRVSGRCQGAGAHQVVRAGVSHAAGDSRSVRVPAGNGRDAKAVRPRQRNDGAVREELPGRAAAGRARRAVRADLSRRQRQRRRLGRPRRPAKQPRRQLRAGRQADRRA